MSKWREGCFGWYFNWFFFNETGKKNKKIMRKKCGFVNGLENNIVIKIKIACYIFVCFSRAFFFSIWKKMPMYILFDFLQKKQQINKS